MAQQSLYRRYRPRRFSELRGQDHVAKALQHAVANGTEGHAYLFSGPRGTGKTSTARILAKALNCTNLVDGEPCGECDSCVAMDAGTSYDLFELDAASNNGVDAVRDLISRTAVGSPGRTKVYILDEVHMLSTAASNALLKTLEEPPPHVVFVLATTDPQKVLPTIRSRTQHFEFSLLGADELTEHVKWVMEDAGIDLDPSVIPEVVRLGRGSARDTLSALDRVVALGGIDDRAVPSDELLWALAKRDTGDAISAVAAAISTGMEPRTIGEALLGQLRDAFLVAVKADTPHLTDDDRERSAEVASTFGTAGITRALELLGAALVDMRQATDQRIPLEVAVVRLCHPDADTSAAALVDRVAQLERLVRSGGVAPDAGGGGVASAAVGAAAVDAVEGDVATPGQAQEPEAGAAAPSPAGRGGVANARAQLGARRASSAPPVPGRRADAPAAPAPSNAPSPSAAPAPPTPPAPGPQGPQAAPRPPAVPTPPAAAPPPAGAGESQATPAPSAAPPGAAPAPAPAAPAAASPAPPAASPGGGGLTMEGAQQALEQVLAASLKGVTRAIYANGRVVTVDGSAVTLAMANAPTRARAEQSRGQVEAALSEVVRTPVTLRLIDETDAPAPAAGRSGAGSVPAAATGAATDATDDTDDADEVVDVHELDDAPPPAASGLDRIQQAFPGATLVEEETR